MAAVVLIVSEGSHMEDYETMSRSAADVKTRFLEMNPNSYFCLATGNTPKRDYEIFVDRYRDGSYLSKRGVRSNIENVRISNLDEYHLNTDYRDYMDRHIIDPLSLNSENVHLIDGFMKCPDKRRGYCVWYEDVIEELGGVDLGEFGLGGDVVKPDGTKGYDPHLAFIPKGTPFDTRTVLVELSEDVIIANEPPSTHAITIGPGTLKDFRNVLLIANGPRKTRTAYLTILGKISPDIQSSVLRTHRNPLFIFDTIAAKEILEYFGRVPTDLSEDGSLSLYKPMTDSWGYQDVCSGRDIIFLMGNYNTLERGIDIFLSQT